MNLTLFFRLITQILFSKNGITVRDEYYKAVKPDYDRCHFYCPRVYANDGFNVSLQINSCNYCESENGYRKLGLTWEKLNLNFLVKMNH